MKREFLQVEAELFLMFVGALAANAESYGRFAGGSWHATQNTWRVGSDYVGLLPSAGDAVRLVSQNEMIDVSDAPVSLGALFVGSWDASFQKQATLVVRANLTVDSLAIGYLNGAPAQQWGNGELVVSGAQVSTGGTTFIGGMGRGSLIVSAGGTFENNMWQIHLAANGTVTIEDGIVSMKNGLIMEEGALVYINGTSELHIVGNNQAVSGSPLLKYIQNGWVCGDGAAGDVQVSYDGEKTVVSVPDK